MLWINRTLFWCILILVMGLALMPQGQAPEGLSWDKLNHAAGFFLFSFLAIRAYPHIPWWPWLVVALCVYGLLMEACQWLLTDDRIPSLADIIANSLGILLFWWLQHLVRRYFPALWCRLSQ